MYRLSIIDDEHLSRKCIIKLLDNKHIDRDCLIEAENGTEALEKFKEKVPDIMLVDLRMPGIDGISLIEKVKADINPDVKAIIISGYSDFECSQKAMQLKVHDYILKPIKKDELNNAVQRVINELEYEANEKTNRKFSEDQLREKIINEFLDGRVINTDDMLRIFPFGRDSRLSCIAIVTRVIESPDNHSKISRIKDNLIKSIFYEAIPEKDVFVFFKRAENLFSAFLSYNNSSFDLDFYINKLTGRYEKNGIITSIGIGAIGHIEKNSVGTGEETSSVGRHEKNGIVSIGNGTIGHIEKSSVGTGKETSSVGRHEKNGIVSIGNRTIGHIEKSSVGTGKETSSVGRNEKNGIVSIGNRTIGHIEKSSVGTGKEISSVGRYEKNGIVTSIGNGTIGQIEKSGSDERSINSIYLNEFDILHELYTSAFKASMEFLIKGNNKYFKYETISKNGNNYNNKGNSGNKNGNSDNKDNSGIKKEQCGNGIEKIFENLFITGFEIEPAIRSLFNVDKYSSFSEYENTLRIFVIDLQKLMNDYNVNMNILSETDRMLMKCQSIEQITSLIVSTVSSFVKETGRFHISDSANSIKVAVEYIKKHYREDITLNKVSALVHINPNYFCELFKKATGKTFLESLTQLRIDKAIELLQDGSLKIYEIANYVGYENENYFSRIFKKTTGLDPSKYRREHL